MSKVKSSCLPAMSPFLIKFSFSKHFEAWHYPNTLMENHGKPTPTENQLVPRSLGSSQHHHPRVRRTGQHNRSRHRPSTGSPAECSFLATATASGIALGDIAWEYTTILRGMNMDEYSVNHLEMGWENARMIFCQHWRPTLGWILAMILVSSSWWLCLKKMGKHKNPRIQW